MPTSNQLRPGRPWPSGTGGSGFTLIEMLVSIVIMGLVGAALVGVLREQRTFYEENSRLVTAQRSLRGAADWMSTELRMVHRGGVQTAETDRLIVEHAVARGVVCDTSATGSPEVYLNFYQRPTGGTPQSMRYLEPRYQGSWLPAAAWGDLSQQSHTACAGTPPSNQLYVTDSWPDSLPSMGSMVRGTRPLTYEFRTQGSELMLLRNGRVLAGPFEQSSPYFEYYRKDGSQLSAPVTGATRDEIASVQIDATATGHEQNARYQGERIISLRVPFRN